MKRCVLFFIVLVSTLVLAALTDDNRPSLGEEGIVKYNKMQNDVNIAEHRILPIPNY